MTPKSICPAAEQASGQIRLKTRFAISALGLKRFSVYFTFSRQSDANCCAFVRNAFDLNASGVFLHDAPANGKSKSGPFPFVFGREKWVHYFGQNFGRNSMP